MPLPTPTDLAAALIALVVIVTAVSAAVRARRSKPSPYQRLHRDADTGDFSAINTNPAPPRFVQGVSPLAQLSERELEITQLVAQGMTNKAIAAETGLSINTVQSHLRRVFIKLGVHSRSELTRRVTPYLAEDGE